MYDFHDLGPVTTGDETLFIPSEALMISGKTIEEQIDGYQTLTVTGRGPLAYAINSEDVDGSDGKHYIDAYLADRPLGITYRLVADTAADMMDKLDKLSTILANKQADCSFKDQPDWHFTVTLSGTTDPEEGKLDAKGSFILTASDPHKYSASQSLSGATIDFGSKTGQLISIEYTPTATATDITIASSKGYAIKLVNVTVNAGDTIILKPQDQTVTLNGVNKAMWLTYDTDFENVPAAGKLTVSPAGTLKVTFKEVR